MKLLLIAPINSVHTMRWANSLINYVDELTVASLHDVVEELDSRIVVYKLPHKAPFGYFSNCFALKRVINRTNPDLIHTHFMSGYGTLAALSVNKTKTPHILSMWGSDIYDFPKKSIFHKLLIRWIANKANILASTSHVMKKQFYKVYPKYVNPIEVTPFGVDTDAFTPIKKDTTNNCFSIGLAKNMEDKYGVNYLIEGFAMFNKKHPNSNLNIIGSGSKLEDLKVLASTCNCSGEIKFYGRISNDQLPVHINSWDICVIPSVLHSESFGVSAVEASSCGIPVIASNVGGLPEVIENNITGIIVPPRDAVSIANALDFCLNNKLLIKEMGLNGRKKVLEQYSWEKNVEQMFSLYKRIIKND